MKSHTNSTFFPAWVLAALLSASTFMLADGISTAIAAETATAAIAADNAIETVDYSSAQNGKVVVKIGLKQPLQAAPAGFIVNNPPRIALDFPNTANKLGKNTVQAEEGALRSVNVVQAGNRTRMVLNLSKPAGYETKAEGKTLLVVLQSQDGAKTTTNITPRFAEAQPSAQPHSVRDIDFRRGSNNEGRIVTDLSDTSVGIDIRKQGKDIVVDIGDTSLPTNLERKLDVVDFGTPVQMVDTFRRGQGVRMVITPKGNWEYSAYQTDRQFIVEVKAAPEDAGKPALGQGKGYTGEKLSLNFQNVEVRAVLQVIADFTGLNIITSDSVSGNLTLRLKDVPWDQALAIILQSKGLDMRRSGNVIWIAPRDELATKEKLDLESRQQISDLEPVQTERFAMKYQKAADVQKILGDPNQKILSKRGSVVVDVRTNSLFVQDTPTKLGEVRQLIDQIDIPVKQVLIDSRIVEANDSFSRNLGAKLGLNDMQSAPSLTAGNQGIRANVGGTLDATGFMTGQVTTRATLPQTESVNLPASGIGGFNAGAIAFSIFHANSARFLNLELSALEADGNGKIISNPRVVTADQVEATIEQGTEIPYQQATSSGATSVSFKKATLSLKVKPQITPDDNVIMDLKVNKDSPGATTTAGPAIDTKQITTQVLVENGGTVVIGGIYTQDKRETVTKVPLLGDVPVVGFLFKNRASQDNKTELLIFVTPKIVKEGFGIQ